MKAIKIGLVLAGCLLNPIFSQAREIVSLDLEPYSLEASQRIHSSINQSYGSQPQLIYGIDQWTNAPQSLWENYPPGVRNPKIVLYPAAARVFSKPSSYLLPEWEPSMVHSILMVSQEAQTMAPFHIPQVLKRKVGKNKFAYDFYLPKGVGGSELIKMMHYLQRKAQGDDVGDFSLYEGLVGLPERVTRQANENLDGMDDESNCPPIITDDQKAVVRDMEASPEKIAELWEVALMEISAPTKKEFQDEQIMRDIFKKRKNQNEVWEALSDIGSDDIVEKLRDIIFSSASPGVRQNAFDALFKILDRRKDREGLMSLLEQGILDFTLAKHAYYRLEDLYESYEEDIQPYEKIQVETIIARQLESQTRGSAISFFFSYSDTTPSNQLRAVLTLDHYLATSPPSPKGRGPKDGRNPFFIYPDERPEGLLHVLLSGVQHRLSGTRKKIFFEDDEENKENALPTFPTSDDLQFVNHALPVIIKHLH